MEKQLQSLTALVKELTQSHEPPSRLGQLIDSNAKSLYQQLKDLKARTHHLRDDLTSIRRMQQSLQDNFQLELEEANHKIEVIESSDLPFRSSYLGSSRRNYCSWTIRENLVWSKKNWMDTWRTVARSIETLSTILRGIRWFSSPLLVSRDLEISVEQLQNDVKTKQCHITINDVETFALVLSTISRSLVDLKGIATLFNDRIHFLFFQPRFQPCARNYPH